MADLKELQNPQDVKWESNIKRFRGEWSSFNLKIMSNNLDGTTFLIDKDYTRYKIKIDDLFSNDTWEIGNEREAVDLYILMTHMNHSIDDWYLVGERLEVGGFEDGKYTIQYGRLKRVIKNNIYTMRH